MKDVLKFSLPGKPEYVRVVKLAIGSIGETAGFSMEAIDDIKIAVAEACKNITCHGFDGFSNVYEVECQSGDDEIIVTVSDKSCEHGLEKHIKPCLDCPNEGNLAIYVIKSLMDSVEVIKEKKGNRSIQMVKKK
ncbi:MAG: ATP-binding protein [Anaerovoracaceae bacterium]